MDGFKYPLGTRLKNDFTTYTVVGHTVYMDGSRGYVVVHWKPSHMGVGYEQLSFSAALVEDERTVKVVED